MMAVFNNLDEAAHTITDIIKNRVIPATLEIMDNTTIRTVEDFARVGLPLEAEAVLLIEVDGAAAVVEKEVAVVLEVCRGNNAARIQIAETDEERDKLWAARRAALPAIGSAKAEYLEWELGKTGLEVMRKILPGSWPKNWRISRKQKQI